MTLAERKKIIAERRAEKAKYANLNFQILIVFIAGGLALCIGVGVISGYYPALKASRLDPVEALRYE